MCVCFQRVARFPGSLPRCTSLGALCRGCHFGRVSKNHIFYQNNGHRFSYLGRLVFFFSISYLLFSPPLAHVLIFQVHCLNEFNDRSRCLRFAFLPRGAFLSPPPSLQKFEAGRPLCAPWKRRFAIPPKPSPGCHSRFVAIRSGPSS